MRVLLLAATTSLLCAAQVRAGAAVEPSDPRPHYVRAGWGFSCTTSKADGAAADQEKRDPCLRMGPLYIGMSRATLEAVLGKPVATRQTSRGLLYDYPLRETELGDVVTYVLVTYRPDGKAKSIQLTGLPWTGELKFAGLTLGDSVAKLTERLGKAHAYSKSDEPGTIAWDYTPWMFSIEVHRGQISSIRLAEPEGSQ